MVDKKRMSWMRTKKTRQVMPVSEIRGVPAQDEQAAVAKERDSAQIPVLTDVYEQAKEAHADSAQVTQPTASDGPANEKQVESISEAAPNANREEGESASPQHTEGLPAIDVVKDELGEVVPDKEAHSQKKAFNGWFNLGALLGRGKKKGKEAVVAPAGELSSPEQMATIYAMAEQRKGAQGGLPALEEQAAGLQTVKEAEVEASVAPVQKVDQAQAQAQLEEVVQTAAEQTPAPQTQEVGQGEQPAQVDASLTAEQQPQVSAQAIADSAGNSKDYQAAAIAPAKEKKKQSMLSLAKVKQGIRGLRKVIYEDGGLRDTGTEAVAEDGQRFTAVPIRALFGYLPDVRETDALEYALGYAADFIDQQGMAFYDAFPYKRGYAFEVQQGGDGRAFLPEILEYFNTRGEFEPGEDVRVVIKTATRKAEVFRTREGLDFVILPEGSDKEVTPWLKGSSNLTPAVNRKTGFFVISAAFFATGFIAMLFSSMLTRYQDYEPAPKPKEEFVNFAETPSGQWNQLKNVPPNSYVKALRFRNGKWEAPDVTVDIELVKPRAVEPAAGEANAPAGVPPVPAPTVGPSVDNVPNAASVAAGVPAAAISVNQGGAK